jgi:signal transduction histidine kinase
MSAEISEVVIIVLAGTFLMLLLVIFIISFFFVHQRRQERFKQEKAALKAQFDQEILTSQNEIQEETMKYISRELHDNVVQMLALVKIQLNTLSENYPKNTQVIHSKEYLSFAIDDLRAFSKTLNTDNILHEGIVKTIRFELKRLEKASGIKATFTESTDRLPFDSKQEIVIFRIFQELIQNIIKHAQAKNISVLLEQTKEFFKLEVRDDGVGFDFEKKLQKKGFDSGSGLANMMYRASLLKGSLKVTEAPHQGSISTLLIPL